MGYSGVYDPTRATLVAGLDQLKAGYQTIEASQKITTVNSNLSAPAHVTVEIGKGRVIEPGTVAGIEVGHSGEYVQNQTITNNSNFTTKYDQAWSPGSSPEPSPENKQDLEGENDQKPDPSDLSKDPGSFRYPDVTNIGNKEADSNQKPKKNRGDARHNIVNRALISKRTRSVVVMPIKIKNEPKGIKNYFR